MTVYAIAQLTITDRSRYQRYQTGFMSVLGQYGGRLLVADEAPAVVEGRWDHQKIVVLEFKDAAAFRAWAESPEYRQIAIDRLAGAHTLVVLARGVAG
jgi:uncharacterized protein (DUF1330 family)